MTQVASLTASLELNSSSFVSNAEKARRAMQATANGIKADTEAMAGSLGGVSVPARTVCGRSISSFARPPRRAWRRAGTTIFLASVSACVRYR